MLTQTDITSEASSALNTAATSVESIVDTVKTGSTTSGSILDVLKPNLSIFGIIAAVLVVISPTLRNYALTLVAAKVIYDGVTHLETLSNSPIQQQTVV